MRASIVACGLVVGQLAGGWGQAAPDALADDDSDVPHWVAFPDDEWVRITPEQAGLDVGKFQEFLEKADVRPGGWGGIQPTEKEWGAVLTRGGYMIQTWGDPKYKHQSASLGKCFTRLVFGLAVEAGVIKPDEPICKTWTGEGQLSHSHKYLDAGLHRTLTWNHLQDQQGGFVLESGYHWRRRIGFHANLPAEVKWTGDPLFDNFAHIPPGTVTRYSSGGYVRLGQALTAAWDCDLKAVLDKNIMQQIGIPADRWDWLPGSVVRETKDFYPAFPGYGGYVGPPDKINGHVVRGGPGWVVMSSEDLARVGLLVATGGIWKSRRLIGAQWCRGHGGVNCYGVIGDRHTFISAAKIHVIGGAALFGNYGGDGAELRFPKELIVGPVRVEESP